MNATCSSRLRLGAVVAFAAATLGVLASGAPAAQAAASVEVTEHSVDVSNFPATLDSCVNSGNGEVILISGTLHTVTAVRNDATGGFHATVQTNLAGMSAVGASSGDSYVVTGTAGGEGGRINAYVPPGGPPPRTITQSQDIRFVSQGSGDNLLIRNTFHLTINANGDVTVGNPTFEALCVG